MLKWLWRRWEWAASILALALVGSTYGDFGVTWDEGVQARYGELCLAYFASGFSEHGYADLQDLRFYGPIIGFGVSF